MNTIAKEDANTIASAKIDWNKLRGKTVLISGANGYVPQYFVHGLLARNDLFQDGIKIIALCRDEERAMFRFSQYKNRGDFILLIGNVAEAVSYNGGVDYIIHAASPASLKVRYDDPVSVFEANVLGCRNLLELALHKKAQMLLVSSVDVYGDNNGNRRLTEDFSGSLDSLNIRNIYACAKRAAETLCICYSSRGASCKIVRPVQILGGGIALDDGRLHIDFISQMMRGNSIVLKGDGSPRRSFLYITDAIIGMLTVMLEGHIGEAYNLAEESGEASVLELAQTMASLVDERKIEITYNMETRKKDPAVMQTISVVCADATKIHGLCWRAKVSLRDACGRMMAYYGL